LPGKLRSVHLELTTRCNARCPMCPRTGRGVTRSGLVMLELSLPDVEAILPPPLLADLRHIDLCGGFGDPLVAIAFDDVIDYFRRANPEMSLDIYTNGSLRPRSWWPDLARRLGSRSCVIFGIDGLADTHARYRVGTKFERIIDNARRFIAAGGRAQWDFIVFRHNQHQVDTARALAQELGFTTFAAKVSGRFYKRYYEETPDLAEDEGYDTFPIYDHGGRRKGHLELPTDPQFRNSTLERMNAEVAARGTLLPALDAACISCRAISDRSCFVSAEGTVFPCCWTYGASKYGSVFGMSAEEDLLVARLLEKHGGADAIDAKKYPLEDIIEGPFFRAVARTWRAPSIAAGKAKICARMCGPIFSQTDQFANPQLSPWRVHAARDGDGLLCTRKSPCR
jgi:MoaA/NifB/PqqE/SkfB family radical SAM enzyme